MAPRGSAAWRRRHRTPFERGRRPNFLPNPGDLASIAEVSEFISEIEKDGKGIPVLKMHILPDAMSRRTFDILKKQVAEIGIRVEPIAVRHRELHGVGAGTGSTGNDRPRDLPGARGSRARRS